VKKQLLRFGPWVALLVLGTIATPRAANTAPPPEPHPRMHAAIDALREARAEMEKAAHDFCGHKVAAMRDTQAALNQLQEALRCPAAR